MGIAIDHFLKCNGIEITHKSSSRATYAQGSLRAVRFLAGQSSGLFDMFDVLGLK